MIVVSNNHQKGFTIIELMIATVVFSVVILVVTTGIIRLGNMYYKGITSSKVQDVSRQITNDLSSTAQMSQSVSAYFDSSDNKGWFCAGKVKYFYWINKPATGAPDQGLIAKDIDTGGDCGSVTASGGKQLLGNNMRLLKFSVTPNTATGLTSIGIKVAYGDDDLLTDISGSPPSLEDYANRNCKSGIAGSSFCATAELDTVVKKRLNSY